jgi:hypothetical protein
VRPNRGASTHRAPWVGEPNFKFPPLAMTHHAHVRHKYQIYPWSTAPWLRGPKPASPAQEYTWLTTSKLVFMTHQFWTRHGYIPVPVVLHNSSVSRLPITVFLVLKDSDTTYYGSEWVKKMSAIGSVELDRAYISQMLWKHLNFDSIFVGS